MTSNGRLEEVVEALLERVEVLEQKAGIRNSNIIKNPRLMVVENANEYSPKTEYIPIEDDDPEPNEEVFSDSIGEEEPTDDSAEPVEYTPEEVEGKEPIEDSVEPVEYEPTESTEDSKIEPTAEEEPTEPDDTVEEKPKKNTKKSKK